MSQQLTFKNSQRKNIFKFNSATMVEFHDAPDELMENDEAVRSV